MKEIFEFIACYYVAFFLGLFCGATITYFIDRAVKVDEYTEI